MQHIQNIVNTKFQTCLHRWKSGFKTGGPKTSESRVKMMIVFWWLTESEADVLKRHNIHKSVKYLRQVVNVHSIELGICFNISQSLSNYS